MLNFNQIAKQLRRSIAALLLVTALFFSGLAPAQALPTNTEDRGSDTTRASDTTYKGRNVIQADGAKPDADTVKTLKKIQGEAEDLGDSPSRPIGETGLKNIRKLGENIPETLGLKAEQTKDIYTSDSDNALEKNPLEAVKEKIGEAVERLK
ncbi:MAG TPA: hypothetical protein V6D18_16320 [Thermosynechococcaceae cyanobacterium]